MNFTCAKCGKKYKRSESDAHSPGLYCSKECEEQKGSPDDDKDKDKDEED